MPRRGDIEHVLVIGSGPIVIGQAAEFDYSGTQACRVLKAEGLRVTLINSNPASIMTDPEFADSTYIEPITAAFVEKVIVQQAERGNKIDALLATLGGQTALNTAVALYENGALDRHGVEMIGADFEAIQRGEAGERLQTDVGEAQLTHVNLYDGTIEGIRLLDVPAGCVQYHPEAGPGPHDSLGLFDEFIAEMTGATA